MLRRARYVARGGYIGARPVTYVNGTPDGPTPEEHPALFQPSWPWHVPRNCSPSGIGFRNHGNGMPRLRVWRTARAHRAWAGAFSKDDARTRPAPEQRHGQTRRAPGPRASWPGGPDA